MNRRLALVLIAATALTAGCARKPPAPATSGPRFDSVRKGDLSIRLEINKDTLAPGESFVVTVKALNTGSEPIHLTADTGAKAYVQIYHNTGLGWEHVATYPQAATQVVTPWTLQPGVQWVQHMTLTVSPDWPQNEPLRVVAHLNGAPNIRPMLLIEVQPPGQPATQPAAKQ